MGFESGGPVMIPHFSWVGKTQSAVSGHFGSAFYYKNAGEASGQFPTFSRHAFYVSWLGYLVISFFSIWIPFTLLVSLRVHC